MYSLTEYLDFAKEIYQARGPRGVYKEGKSYAYESLLRGLAPLIDNEPDYVIDQDWDVLLILDACRVDLLEEVADEYDFLPDPPYDHIWSADSYSEGWLKANFTGKTAETRADQYATLSHITGNPFTNTVFENGHPFGHLDEVWRYGWDDERGLIPPEVLTDRAITHHREHNPDRMLVHYMQPHAPFISDTTFDYHIDTDHFANPKGTVSSATPWELLRDGEVELDAVWSAYKDTLRAVLDSVEILLDNIDAETVAISADHGNAVGEWGIYGHPRAIPIAPLREVPWVTTSATNNNTYEPPEHKQEDDFDRTEQLEKLGYL